MGVRRWFNNGTKGGLYCEIVSDTGDRFDTATTESAEKVTRLLNAMELLFEQQVEYSVQLQQIIEAVRRGRDVPHQHLHHGEMAAKHLRETQQVVANIRDAVLHERYQLEDAGLDSDQVNAVLGIIDDATTVIENGDAT